MTTIILAITVVSFILIIGIAFLIVRLDSSVLAKTLKSGTKARSRSNIAVKNSDPLPGKLHVSDATYETLKKEQIIHAKND